MFTRILFSGIVGMALTFSAGAYAGDLVLGGNKAAPDRFAANAGRHFGDEIERRRHERCQHGQHWGCHRVGSEH
jgi:hypothetical protein